MVSLDEGVLGALALGASILYFFVARIQANREVSPEARPPLIGFIVWWAGLGVVGLISAILQLGPSVETLGIGLYRVVIYGLAALIFAMLGGLVYYLLYLYTGARSSLWVAVAFYMLLLAFVVWLIEWHAPHIATGHAGSGQEAESVFHMHVTPPLWQTLTLTLGLLVPPLAAAIAYGMLFWRIHDRTARYRIALVSAGFLLWFGFSLVGSLARDITGQASRTFAGQVTSQLLGILAASLVLLAYNPPRRLRQRLSLRRIDEPIHGSRDMFDARRRSIPSARWLSPVMAAGAVILFVV